MPEPGELNVRLFFDTFGSEILDLDREGSDGNEQEGFNIPDQGDPLAFRLAPNLCANNSPTPARSAMTTCSGSDRARSRASARPRARCTC
jgi:hypothetical protein